MVALTDLENFQHAHELIRVGLRLSSRALFDLEESNRIFETEGEVG